MKRLAWFLIGILILSNVNAQVLDIESVPPDVAATISTMAAEVIKLEEVSHVNVLDYGDREINITLYSSLERIHNRLYKRKRISFKYDPKGILTNPDNDHVRRMWGGDVFTSSENSPWIRNGHVFRWHEVAISYFFLVDQPPRPPRLIQVYFPMSEETWQNLCDFLDEAKIEKEHPNGKTYTIGVNDIKSVGLWQRGLDKTYAVVTQRDETVSIDLKNKSYSVSVLGPR